MNLQIAKSVAVVAASTKGLGRACAHALAAEGARVVVNGRSQADAEAAAAEIAADTGADTLGVGADLTAAAGVEHLIARTEAAFGPPGIAVVNTGGPAPGTFDDISDADWHAGLDTTVVNAARIIRWVLPGMRAAGFGRIVCITSVAAIEPIQNLIISNALRAAVHGLVKTVSRETAPHGVTINAVMPGLHATDRLVELAELRAKANSTDTTAELEAMARDIPVGRLGEPAEFAAAVAFLCSRHAAFITGTTLLIDGGATRGTR